MRWLKSASIPGMEVSRTDFHPDIDNSVTLASTTYEVKDKENGVKLMFCFYADGSIEYTATGPDGAEYGDAT